jgi:hypothetical protein
VIESAPGCTRCDSGHHAGRYRTWPEAGSAADAIELYLCRGCARAAVLAGYAVVKVEPGDAELEAEFAASGPATEPRPRLWLIKS